MFRDSSKALLAGLMWAIITVRLFPPRESWTGRMESPKREPPTHPWSLAGPGGRGSPTAVLSRPHSCSGQVRQSPRLRSTSPLIRTLGFYCCLVARSFPTLCDSFGDCSSPGFSVHRISQARILEWAAISFSRGSSGFWDRTQVSCFSK